MKKRADNIKKNADKIVAQAAIAIVSNLVQETPEDTGRAKGNYFSTVGSPSSGEVLSGFSESVGNSNITENTVLNGQSIYIVNNLPYIIRLDNGWSPKNSGFVARSVQIGNDIISKGKLLDGN